MYAIAMSLEDVEARVTWRQYLPKTLHQYPRVGPMKQFFNKKAICQFIPEKMKKRGRIQTKTQVENRYKTVINRRSVSKNNNSSTGANYLIHILTIKMKEHEPLEKLQYSQDLIEGY